MGWRGKEGDGGAKDEGGREPPVFTGHVLCAGSDITHNSSPQPQGLLAGLASLHTGAEMQARRVSNLPRVTQRVKISLWSVHPQDPGRQGLDSRQSLAVCPSTSFCFTVSITSLLTDPPIFSLSPQKRPNSWCSSNICFHLNKHCTGAGPVLRGTLHQF